MNRLKEIKELKRIAEEFQLENQEIITAVPLKYGIHGGENPFSFRKGKGFSPPNLPIPQKKRWYFKNTSHIQ